jgi:N-terminal domain of toast_rack, DUF2154
MAQDSGRGPRRTSLFLPILLIAAGVAILYLQRHPEVDFWPILRTYWPVILICLGVGKIWDSWRTRNNPVSSGPSVGGVIAAIAVVAIFVALIRHNGGFGRWGSDRVYAMQHSDRSVDRDDAKTVEARIKMGAGDLDISGGARHLLDADFDYRGSFATPQVVYSISGITGNLEITQDNSQSHFTTSSDNHWTLHLANNVPLQLHIEMGAGRGNLRLRDIQLTDLTLKLGAGQVDLDLTGDHKQNLTADIEGGVGEADIRLPKNIGVVVNARGGLGTIDTTGLRQDGDEYINDAYGKSSVTIRLRVRGGIGHISLTEE